MAALSTGTAAPRTVDDGGAERKQKQQQQRALLLLARPEERGEGGVEAAGDRPAPAAVKRPAQVSKICSRSVTAAART